MQGKLKRMGRVDKQNPEKSGSSSPLPHPRYFPPAWQADEEGILCVGGSLKPDLLLDAYRHGIFPWPIDDRSPLFWWSPDPRAVIEFDRFHVPRRLERRIKSGRFRVTFDRDFSGVIRSCAREHSRTGGTWITRNMIAAYERMHELGHCHSVEVWRNDELVGGTYGVGIGAFFAAESMFHVVTDASKVALVSLVKHLQSRGYRLLDIQQLTPHTVRFGAVEIPRQEYLQRLAEAIVMPVTFGDVT
jgi:leucyl/phenylalanyl-tRNA---protein transferase